MLEQFLIFVLASVAAPRVDIARRHGLLRHQNMDGTRS
jgi:hypothetical protein